jgi:hypothetical protein
VNDNLVSMIKFEDKNTDAETTIKEKKKGEKKCQRINLNIPNVSCRS